MGIFDGVFITVCPRFLFCESVNPACFSERRKIPLGERGDKMTEIRNEKEK